MANQQSLSVNDYVFAKPRAADGRGSKRGGGIGGGGDRGRNKFPKAPLFDAFRRPMSLPPPRSPFHRGGAVGAGIGSGAPILGGHPPPRHRPPIQPPPHQRGVGPGPPPANLSQQQQQQKSPNFPKFSNKMMIPIPNRPSMMAPSSVSSSYPPSSSFPPSTFPPSGPPPTGPPPTGPPPPSGPPPSFGGGGGGFPPPRAFFHPYFNNIRPHPHKSEGHHNQGKQFHEFHQAKRGHHHQSSRAKCKKNYRPHNKPRFCKKRGRGAPGLAKAMDQRSKAPSNSALTTSFIMSDYYRQEAVASPDLRGNAGTHGIPGEYRVIRCKCNKQTVYCTATVGFREVHN